MKFIELPSSRYREWDEFAESNPYGTPFHQSGINKIFQAEAGGEFRIYAYLLNGRIAAGFPFYSFRTRFYNLIKSPFSFKYYGILISPELMGTGAEKKLLRSYCEFFSELPGKIELDQSFYIDDARYFLWSGFEVLNFYTHIVPGDTEPDELIGLSSKSIRNKSRRFSELEIVRNIEMSDISELWRKLSSGIHEEVEFRRMVKILEKVIGRDCIIYGVRGEGGLIAYTIVLRDSRMYYNWFAGADKDLERLYPQAYIYLKSEIIRDGLEAGRPVDLCGTNIRRIAAFKEQFYGVRRSYFRVRRYNGFIPRMFRGLKIILNRDLY